MPQIHLLDGKKVTRLEAMILFGVSNLTAVIASMKKQKYIIESEKIPYATALRRANEYVLITVPKELPIREIQLIQYWLNK